MKPPSVPQRTMLVSQTIALLERGLREIRWANQLPASPTATAQLIIA